MTLPKSSHGTILRLLNAITGCLNCNAGKTLAEAFVIAGLEVVEGVSLLIVEGVDPRPAWWLILVIGVLSIAAEPGGPKLDHQLGIRFPLRAMCRASLLMLLLLLVLEGSQVFVKGEEADVPDLLLGVEPSKEPFQHPFASW